MTKPRWFVSSLTLVGVIILLFLALSTHECFAEKPLSEAEYRALWEKKGKSAEDFEVLNRERKYRVFRPVIGILPQVLLHGSANKLGLDGMDDYLKLRLANDLRDYTNKDTKKFWEIAFFVCDIWTVREKNPIALHMKCRASVLDETEDWSNELLAIEMESSLTNTVKNTLSDFVQEFAVFFLKAKGIL